MLLSEYLKNIYHPHLCLYLDLNQSKSHRTKSYFWSQFIPYSLIVDGMVDNATQPVYLDHRSYNQLKAGDVHVNVIQSIKQNGRALNAMLGKSNSSVFVIRHGESMNFRSLPNIAYPVKFYVPEPWIPWRDEVRLQYLPFGRDRHLQEFFTEAYTHDISDKKDILVTAGFSCGNTPQRGEWADRIENHTGLTIDHECMTMGHHNQPILDQGEAGCNLFASKLIRSKFTLCPPSTTIDTTRFWDALSVGSIPIVLASNTGVKNIRYGLSQVYNFYSHVEQLYVPYLIVTPDTFNGLTDNDLEEVWEDFMSADWNFECLCSDYWIKDMNEFLEAGESYVQE